MILQASEQYMKQYQKPDIEPVTERQNLPRTETLFAALRRSKIPDEEKTASRMAQEGVEMFMAAYTPGRLMITAMYHLHAQPRVLETLRKELDEANPDQTHILDFKTLNGLPYMRSVTKEILRIGFPIGSRLPMVCRQDLEYGSWTIPAGVSPLRDPCSLPPSLPPSLLRIGTDRAHHHSDAHLRQPPQSPQRPARLPGARAVQTRALARRRPSHRRKALFRALWQGLARVSGERVSHIMSCQFANSFLPTPQTPATPWYYGF